MAIYSIVSNNISLYVVLGNLAKVRIEIMGDMVIWLKNSKKISSSLPDSEVAGMAISSIFCGEYMKAGISRAHFLHQ